jgi:hypothetical protein
MKQQWRIFLLGVMLCWADSAVLAQMSLDDAASEVRRRTGGRVLSGETERRQDESETHRFKVLTPEGRVRRVEFDPYSRRVRD